VIGDADLWWRDYLIDLLWLFFGLRADQEAGDDVTYAGCHWQQAKQPDDPHYRLDDKWNLVDDVWWEF